MIISKPLDKHGNRKWKVTTPPIIEPITLDELKSFARIDGTEDDVLLEGFIRTIREAMESYLKRALISQTITLQMDFWPGTVIELPMPPLISITSVSTIDEDDVETVYDSDNYYVHTDIEPGELVLKNGVTAPYNSDRYHGGYRIVYLAGYGYPSDVPQIIKDSMKLWCAIYYETRMLTEKPPSDVISLLERFYRIIRI